MDSQTDQGENVCATSTEARHPRYHNSMRTHQDAEHDIATYTEAGDLEGWCAEHEARSLVSRHLATVQCERRGRRRIVLTADEAAPLRGAAKQKAIAGYVGAVKYTYHEDIGVERVIGHQVMLKRLLSDGRFVKWPGNERPMVAQVA